MEVPKRWIPRTTSSKFYRLPPLEDPGNKSKPPNLPNDYYLLGVPIYIAINNESVGYCINDSKSACIQLQVRSDFATIVLFLKEAPTEPQQALFIVELVHPQAVLTGDVSKNKLSDEIVYFRNDDWIYSMEDCLNLKTLETEGFMHTHPELNDSYLFVRVHMHILRNNKGPGIYLPILARSYMITSYGDQVIKKLKDVCKGYLKQFDKGLGKQWASLQDEERDKFKTDFLGPIDKDQLLGFLQNFSDSTSVDYPLVMELLHMGIINADKSAGWFGGYEQWISFDEKLYLKNKDKDKDLFSNSGIFNVGDKYTSWTNSKTNTQAIAGDLMTSGWCAVQLVTVYYYFCQVTLVCDDAGKERKVTVEPTVSAYTEPYDEDCSTATECMDLGPHILKAEDLLPAEPSERPRTKTITQADVEIQPIINGEVTWIFPSAPDVYRIDSDGALNRTLKTAAHSCIIRRYRADGQAVEDVEKDACPIKVVAAISCATEPETSQYHEFRGVHRGCTLADELKLKKAEIRTDNTSVIWQVLQGFPMDKQIGQGERLSSLMGSLIDEIVVIMGKMEHRDIKHMKRGGNEVANLLATMLTTRPGVTLNKEMRFSEEDFETRDELAKIKAYLHSDAAGRWYPADGSVRQDDE